MDQVTENPGVGDTEVWEIYNTTADAHPMHIHELAFEVVNRQRLVRHEEEVVQPIRLDRNITPPKSWETGVKDTVVALPGHVTRSARSS
jgi:spore coat protein A, manganese oxidase